MKKIGNDSVVSACSQRVSAIKKHLSAKDEIFVNGEQMKAGDVALVFQQALDTRAATVTAKGEYKSALAEREAADVKRVTADAALMPYVLQRFGANSTEAHDFGFGPKKATAKSAVTKAKATILGKATREARGTMSAKAKQQIKGTLSPEAAAALEVLASAAASGSQVATSAPVASAPVVSGAVATPVAAAPTVAAAPAAAVNGAVLNGAAHS